MSSRLVPLLANVLYENFLREDVNRGFLYVQISNITRMERVGRHIDPCPTLLERQCE